jgi:hypothetical protein
VKFLDISDFVRTEARGAPEFLVERVVRESATEFCVKTDVYRLEPETIQVISGIDEYDLTIPNGTELNHIIDVYRGHRTLQPVSYSRLLEVKGDGTTTGQPRCYSQLQSTSFYVAPVPSASETLSVLYSVKPTSTASSIPDYIGKAYREPIVHGALYRLQMMPNQPWSDQGSAQANKSLCDQRTAQVLREVRYGYGGGSMTVKSRAFI